MVSKPTPKALRALWPECLSGFKSQMEAEEGGFNSLVPTHFAKVAVTTTLLTLETKDRQRKGDFPGLTAA